MPKNTTDKGHKLYKLETIEVVEEGTPEEPDATYEFLGNATTADVKQYGNSAVAVALPKTAPAAKAKPEADARTKKLNVEEMLHTGKLGGKNGAGNSNGNAPLSAEAAVATAPPPPKTSPAAQKDTKAAATSVKAPGRDKDKTQDKDSGKKNVKSGDEAVPADDEDAIPTLALGDNSDNSDLSVPEALEEPTEVTDLVEDVGAAEDPTEAFSLEDDESPKTEEPAPAEDDKKRPLGSGKLGRGAARPTTRFKKDTSSMAVDQLDENGNPVNKKKGISLAAYNRLLYGSYGTVAVCVIIFLLGITGIWDIREVMWGKPTSNQPIVNIDNRDRNKALLNKFRDYFSQARGFARTAKDAQDKGDEEAALRDLVLAFSFAYNARGMFYEFQVGNMKSGGPDPAAGRTDLSQEVKEWREMFQTLTRRANADKAQADPKVVAAKKYHDDQEKIFASIMADRDKGNPERLNNEFQSLREKIDDLQDEIESAIKGGNLEEAKGKYNQLYELVYDAMIAIYTYFTLKEGAKDNKTWGIQASNMEKRFATYDRWPESPKADHEAFAAKRSKLAELKQVVGPINDGTRLDPNAHQGTTVGNSNSPSNSNNGPEHNGN